MTSLAEIPVLAHPFGVDWYGGPPLDTPPPIPDHGLMLAVRDGDLDCMGTLFERHHGPLFGYLSKLTGNRSAAEDIAQTVFQRMLKYRHTYRSEGSFTAWMYRLARHCANDYFRHSSAAPIAVDPSRLEQQVDGASSADETAAAREDHALLHVALGRLDRDDREVLLLARLQELSYAEVADILECSVGAARVRAHRALRALRDLYFKLQKEPIT
jgi:RNA polymerase sigma factor (sigma-70 family)